MTFEKAVQQRKKRIERLRQLLKENADKPLDQILALFAVESGVTYQTALKYYRLLQKAGLVGAETQQH